MSLTTKIQQSIAKLQPVKHGQPEDHPKVAAGKQPPTMVKHRTLPARSRPPKVPPRKTNSICGDIVEGTSITQLAEQSSHLIPFTATVVAGNLDFVPAIKNGDQLTVHAIKESSVVTIADNKDIEYSVPLHSAAKFGIIGNLESEEYMCTFSVSELMEAEKLPPVVACLGDYTGRDKSMTFKQFEILLLKEVTGTFKSYKRMRVIKAYSITNSMTKYVPKECDAFFSSDPSGIQLHLSEIMEYASFLLPCRARLFVPKDYRPLMGDLIKDSVVIKGKSTSKSLLASKVNSKGGEKTYLEISASANILVDSSTQSAKTTRNDLDEKVYTKLSKRKDSLSGCLLKMLREGYEALGSVIKVSKCSESDKDQIGPEDVEEEYETVLPVHMGGSDSESEDPYDDVVWHDGQAAAADLEVTDDKTRKKPAVKPPPLRPPNRSLTTTSASGPPPTFPKSAAAKQYPTKKSWTKSTSSLEQLLQEDYVETESEPPPLPMPRRRESKLSVSSLDIRSTGSSTQDLSLEKLTQGGIRGLNEDKNVAPSAATLDSIQTALSSLMKAVGRLEEKHSQFEKRLAKMESTASTESSKREDREKGTLASMTRPEVQNLLDKLGMPQYKDSFSREGVDGAMLEYLDEEALRELGITSRLHQIKLLRVIAKDYT